MNYWAILGLNEGASIEEIKKAYRILAKKYHPDHNSSPDSERKFREVQAAYEYLKKNTGYKSYSSYSYSSENKTQKDNYSSETKKENYYSETKNQTYTENKKDTGEENKKEKYEEKKAESPKADLGSSFRRNFHERYNRKAYSGTSSSDNSRYHNTNEYNHSSNSFSSRTTSSGYSTSSYQSNLNESSQRFRKAYYYGTPKNTYKKQEEGKTIWELIGIGVLWGLGIVLAVPAAILALLAIIFVSIIVL
ncbi:MAG: DnaJ domain-containing protein [Treponema sp.]|nr:DnaJ domain-containing protein [Treponema sp.]